MPASANSRDRAADDEGPATAREEAAAPAADREADAAPPATDTAVAAAVLGRRVRDDGTNPRRNIRYTYNIVIAHSGPRRLTP